MPAAIPGPNWRYEIGTEIAGREILAQKEARTPADRNVYRVHYACCLRVGDMTQQSLRRLERNHPDEVKPCNTCCALKASKVALAGPEVAAEKPPSDLANRYPGEKPLMTAWNRWAPPKEEDKGKHFICR